MNISKRTFNALKGRAFRYEQTESAQLKYYGNWGAAIQPAKIISSAWEAECGDVVFTDSEFTDGKTSVMISGKKGETVIVNRIVLDSGEIDERVLKLRIDNEYGETTIYDDNVEYLAMDLGSYL